MKIKFKNLKIHLLAEVFVNVSIAVACGTSIYFLVKKILRTPIILFIEYLGMKPLGMTRTGMQVWYARLFQRNEKVIFGIIFALLVIFFLYRAFSKVTDYLNEVNVVMDVVISQDAVKAILPAELKPLEDTINNIKQIIITREAEAKEAEKRKNDLVAYLAHDLKTPLTSVVGYLNLLGDGGEVLSPTAERYADIALQKAKSLEELINEFFEITCYNVQDIVLNTSKVNLTLMLQQISDEIHPMLTDKNLTVELNLTDNLSIIGDNNRLARVFDNLLKNAITYSFANTTITISATQTIKGVEICFSNQGETIPREDLERIFEKFYRLDSSRNSESGSRGLGLAIAREIIRVHGGSITAQSEDSVTKFTVMIPTSSENIKNFAR